MEFRTLGPLEVLDGDRVVEIEGSIRRRILSMLLLGADRPVSYPSLERAGWADDPPPRARRNVQAHISRLRAVGLDIVRAGDGYHLQVPPAAVDAHRFLAACEGTGVSSASAAELRELLSWWRGDAWVDLSETVPVAERGLLDDHRAAVEEQLVLLELLDGNHAAAAGAERLVAEAPRRERRWALLAVARQVGQRRSDALAALQDARAAVAAAGLSPGPMLHELESALLADVGVDGLLAVIEGDGTARRDADRPTVAPAPAGRYRSAFIGRAAELAEVGHLLADERLVTLTGPGGTGKTRLAVEVSARSTLPGEVRFADLTTTGDRSQVLVAIAEVLGADRRRPADIAIQHLLDAFDCLLVVDNCEHVIDVVAPLLEDLLSTHPGLRVLATSREPLGLDGERVVPVPPLDPHTEGVELFRNRAEAAGHRDLPESSAVIGNLCARLDGLPLGIELAAARSVAHSPAELLALLDDGIDVLRDGRRRSGPPRHRTLAATIEWSYDLLTPDEQDCFRRLAVFAGPFVLDSVPRVIDRPRPEAITLLDALVAKSLVTTIDLDGRHRAYRLLETIRAVALERLEAAGDLEVSRERHEKAFVERFERIPIRDRPLSELPTLLGPQVPDLWAAVRHAVEGRRFANAFTLVEVATNIDLGAGTVDLLRSIDDEHGTELPIDERARLLGLLTEACAHAADFVQAIRTSLRAETLVADAGVEARGRLDWVGTALQMGTDPHGALERVGAVTRRWRDAGLIGEHPRSDWTYHLVCALANVRRYEEAIDVGTTYLRAAVRRDPDPIPSVAIAVTWLSRLTDTEAPEECSRALADARPGYAFEASVHVAKALVAPDGPAEAASRLVAIADDGLTSRVPGEEWLLLAAFAVLARSRGDRRRAAELARAADARTSESLVALIEVVGWAEEWDDAEWWERRLAHITARIHDPDRNECKRVLADELDRARLSMSRDAVTGIS